MAEGMVAGRIDPETGKRAPDGMDGAMFGVFREEMVPEEARSLPTLPGGGGKPGGSVIELF